ncbi:unnamed protein product [Cuscuta epithymum]|uniref:Uncharacterized protein n=1 Tax=Cuscuta epithymum TaxID=186058 RepID=A0AAV0G1D3_9ASTE|nr:unnamed protein product [Cuscuta epithymum]
MRLESFVYKYKNIAIGMEEEDLDFNTEDVPVGKSSPGFLVVGVILTIEADEWRVCPPPEPPPWSASKVKNVWVLVWIGGLGQSFKLICFLFLHSDILCCCVTFFVVVVPFCKTIDLDMGDERIAVTVFGSFVPINGLANYIASLEVINSKSGSRDGGC